MKPCKVICKNGEAREINPFDLPHVSEQYSDYMIFQKHAEFECKHPKYPAPGLNDGEHECNLIEQCDNHGNSGWKECGFKECMGNKRMIWVLAFPEIEQNDIYVPLMNNKAVETVEAELRFILNKGFYHQYPLTVINYSDRMHTTLLNSMKEAYYLGAKQQSDGDRWVPASERLPEDFTACNSIIETTREYQIYDETYGVSKGWLKRWLRDNEDTLMPRKKGDILWECLHNSFTRVTHWRNLPSPPTK